LSDGQVRKLLGKSYSSDRLSGSPKNREVYAKQAETAGRYKAFFVQEEDAFSP
jgi:hypothetical protein